MNHPVMVAVGSYTLAPIAACVRYTIMNGIVQNPDNVLELTPASSWAHSLNASYPLAVALVGINNTDCVFATEHEQVDDVADMIDFLHHHPLPKTALQQFTVFKSLPGAAPALNALALQAADKDKKHHDEKERKNTVITIAPAPAAP
jgi:hypothetical protein